MLPSESSAEHTKHVRGTSGGRHDPNDMHL